MPRSSKRRTSSHRTRQPSVIETTPERVNHPTHYNEHSSGVECIEIVEHMSFNVGTAIKHMWRAGLKPGVGVAEDLQKAAWYIARELERLGKCPTC